MGYLSGKTCYLTGPITAVADDGVTWRNSVTGALEGFGVIVDDPTKTTVGGAGDIGKDKARFKELIAQKKFKECKEAFWPVARKDLRSVDKSDFLIFNYEPKVPMFGTIDEIVTASRFQKKPVLMHVAEKDIKDVNPWSLVLVKTECIFTSWQEMMVYLKNIDEKGPTGSQTSYWTLG
jgi:hypothetical protein